MRSQAVLFFQVDIWLACRLYFCASSATVLSSLAAANTTLALNSGELFLRFLVIICSNIVGTIKTDQSLKFMSENWGATSVTLARHMKNNNDGNYFAFRQLTFSITFTLARFNLKFLPQK